MLWRPGYMELAFTLRQDKQELKLQPWFFLPNSPVRYVVPLLLRKRTGSEGY
jgi:hypothetical protein